MGAPGLIAAFTAGAATLAGGRALVHWGIRKGLAAPRVPHHTDPGALGLAFETLRIGTENGKSLHAWFIPGPARAAVADADAATAAAVARKEADVSPAAAPAVVVMHGWGGNAASLLPLAPRLHDAGYSVMLLDARCHGESDDDSFASLPRFAEDIEAGIDWLVSVAGIQRDALAVIGHSVGAGAALLAASRQSSVRAVVSLAAFAHPARMMRRWLAAKRIPESRSGATSSTTCKRPSATASTTSRRGGRSPTSPAPCCWCMAPKTKPYRWPKPMKFSPRPAPGRRVCC